MAETAKSEAQTKAGARSRAAATAAADSSQPTEAQRKAEAAFLASNPGFADAADFLGRVFERAHRTKYAKQLIKWVDPKIKEAEYVVARDSVISDVIQAGKEPVYGLDAKRTYYKKQIEIFTRIVGEQAREFALATLLRQSDLVFRLLTTTRPLVKEMHRAARAVRATVDADEFVLPSMTAEQVREATGETRAGEKRTAGTIERRLRRLFYNYALKQGPNAAQVGRVGSADAAAYRKLAELLIHPRGVEILDAFARSSEQGWGFVSSLFSDSLKSIVELQQKLVQDPEMIWRFAPAVTGGVIRAGLRGRTAAFRFALAWSGSRKTPLEEGLEIAGNVIFVLDLFGGPLGSAVADIAGFVLDVIGAAVSFVRDVEQDMAAESTAFAARAERLSQGSNKIGTVLQGLAAVASGLAVPGALRKVVGVRTTQVIRPPASVDLPPRRLVSELDEARGIANKKTARDALSDANRRTGAKGAGNELTTGSREIRLDPPPVHPYEQKLIAPTPPAKGTAAPALEAKARKRKEAPPYTAAEREARFAAANEQVEKDLMEVLRKKKNGRPAKSAAQAEQVIGDLRKSLPATLPKNMDELEKVVRELMDAAVRQAKSEGFRNTGRKNALGNRAHRYTEFLLDLLNLRLAKDSSGLGVFAEQFRATRRKKRDWILSQNKKNWLGIDAVLYENGLLDFAIDLKTGREWSKAEKMEYLKRFGLEWDELMPHQPK